MVAKSSCAAISAAFVDYAINAKGKKCGSQRLAQARTRDGDHVSEATINHLHPQFLPIRSINNQ